MKRCVLVRRDNYPEGGAYVVACSILKAVQRFNVPIADSYVERGRVIIETDGEKKDVGGMGMAAPSGEDKCGFKHGCCGHGCFGKKLRPFLFSFRSRRKSR